MLRSDKHLLTGIAKYWHCKEPLTVSKGYYCCIGRRKQRCDKRNNCNEPFVAEKELDGQIEWTVERFGLPEFVTDRLIYEADKADQQFINKNRGLLSSLTDELLDIADRLDKIGLAKTTDKQHRAAELLESSNIIIITLMKEQEERVVYEWIKAIAERLGPMLATLMLDPSKFRPLVAEMFEYIYVEKKQIVRFKLAPVYDFTLTWAYRICGYGNPTFMWIIDTFDNLSISEYAKFMTEENRRLSSIALDNPTFKHQQRMYRQELEERKRTDADLFLDKNILSNKTYKDVKRELQKRLKNDPGSQALKRALEDLGAAGPNIKKIIWLRPVFYAELIRDYANTLDFKALYMLVSAKPVDFIL